LVEHWSPKPGVGSSSLSTRANFLEAMNNFIQYIKDSFEELNTNMTWISREEAQKSTVVVAVFTIVFAISVAIIDKGFQFVLDWFFALFNS
jgi:preprotein translocase subunit SecE